MIQEQLKKLGFSGKEIHLYMLLLELGRSTASLLGKKLGIPRTTVYSTLEKLVEKGVVSSQKEKNSTYFIVNNPESILLNIVEEKKLLTKKESIANKLIEELLPFMKFKNFSIPKIQIFEGEKNIENMLYSQEKLWQESIVSNGGVWWGYQDYTFVGKYIKWLKHNWKDIKKTEKVQLITNSSEVEKFLSEKNISNREVREIPNLSFDSTMWICGEYIVLIITRQKPYYAIQIKDTIFSENLKNIFCFLWGLGKEI